MSKRRKQFHVDPGVRKGTKSVSLAASTVKLSGGAPQTFTYNNQPIGIHDQSPLVKVPVVDGWRRPAPYRVFAARVTRGFFNYGYRQSVTDWVASGTTDTASGFGPPAGVVTWGTRLSGGLRVPDVSDSLVNQAITEAKNKLQNQDLNVLTSLGELRETVNFITSLLLKQDKLLTDFINALRRSKISSYELHKAFAKASMTRRRNRMRKVAHERITTRAKTDRRLRESAEARREAFNETLDAVWSLWLAYSFGLSPLIADIKAAANAAHEKLAKAGAHVTALRSITVSGDLYPRAPAFQIWEASGFLKYGAECELRYRVDNARLSLIAALGFLNPLGLAWELTPYSFVVDWFAPVGAWLASLTADVGLVFESGYVNTKMFQDVTYTVCKQYGNGNLPKVRVESVAQFRQSLVTTPFPGLFFTYKSPFSTSHLVSLSALVALFVSNGGR